MRLIKQLGLAMLRTGLTFASAMLLVTAFGHTALAVDPPSAPEIDPGTISSAMTLLAGSVLLITGRRFKK